MIPVRLKYGSSETYSPGGFVTGAKTTKISVKVENIASPRTVVVQYRQTDGSWTEKPVALKMGYGDYDVFSTEFNDFDTNQLVIRYTAGGQTFWDNNQWTDYRFDGSRRGAVGGSVMLNKATAKRASRGSGTLTTTSWFEGEILVSNLSYHKRVGVRWTLNNWASSEDAAASYLDAVKMYAFSSGVEIWKFKTPEYNLSNSSEPNFRFAVFYERLDNRASFWDNNFGHDYTLSKVDGSVLE